LTRAESSSSLSTTGDHILTEERFMARIRLAVAESLRVQPEEVIDSKGQRILLPLLRVFGLLRIGRQARYPRDCIIDPGAPLTLFPLIHWQQFAGDVEWLKPTSTSPKSWLTNVRGRTGGSSSCRIGRVEVVAVDMFDSRQQLAPVWVIAQFEQYLNPDDRILVGLHASILQRRRLNVDPDLPDAWLEDR
jgi:hypothetical protein